MRYDWDPAKHERNLRERGFGFDTASLIFEGDVLLSEDQRFDYGEKRVRANGEVDNAVIVVIFTDDADVRRIISARPANRKEREQWRRKP